MGRKSDLSPRKRGQNKVLFENAELTQCQIALKCGVVQSVVSSFEMNMHHSSTGTPQRKGRCGRRQICSQQFDRALVRLTRVNRKMTLRRLIVEMNSLAILFAFVMKISNKSNR